MSRFQDNQEFNNVSDPSGGIHGDGVFEDTTNPRLFNGVVVLVLMVLNLLGNSVVCYIYLFRVRSSVFSFFVTTLAMLDIITALTTMLMDVIIKTRPTNENILDLRVLCKISHFLVYSQSLISGCVLTLIAFHRYRMICHPLKRRIKVKTAKGILVIIILFCALLNSCTLIINGPQDVLVQVDDHVVNVTICRYDKNFEGPLQTIFSLVLVSAFSLVLCFTIIFSVMVAKTLRNFEHRRSMEYANSPVSFGSDNQKKNLGGNEHSSERRQREVYQQQFYQARMSVTSTGGRYASTQVYRVFAIITVIFIMSYLPHLVVLILTKLLKLDSQILTKTQRILLDLAYNCPYISTVSNPIVYGFRSAEFREQCKIVFTCRRWRQLRRYRQ